MFSFHLKNLSPGLPLACNCVLWTCPSQGKARDDDKHISDLALVNYYKKI